MLNPAVINNAFSRKGFKGLISDAPHDFDGTALSLALKHEADAGESRSSAIHRLYKFGFKNHRCEYFYKNTILNKIVLGRHSMNTACAFEEFHIGKSIADMVIVERLGTVYEIKTDLDNLERLPSQVEDYFKAFTKVVVVCGEAGSMKIAEVLKDQPVGVTVLTDKGTLSERRAAVENRAELDRSVIFNILRQGERDSVVSSLGGIIEDVPPVRRYEERKREFDKLPFEPLYHEFLKTLKKRNAALDQDAIKAVPEELRLLGYMTGISLEEERRLSSSLSRAVYKEGER